jgi:hypothetical protein
MLEIHKAIASMHLFEIELSVLKEIIIPSFTSQEFLHVVLFTFLLCARTFLSIKVAEIAGRNFFFLIRKQWQQMFRGVIAFALIGIPASCVNRCIVFVENE